MERGIYILWAIHFRWACTDIIRQINMAAKDNESVQTFPPAGFDIPPKKHIEEAVVLALNVQDGQQSLGQSVGDPYTRAVRYLEKHHIVEVFQVCVTMATVVIAI